MLIEFDADKDIADCAKHGLSLADAARVDLDRALVIEDRREDYGEIAISPMVGSATAFA